MLIKLILWIFVVLCRFLFILICGIDIVFWYIVLKKKICKIRVYVYMYFGNKRNLENIWLYVYI